MPRRASCSARVGPTPFTYWTGASSGEPRERDGRRADAERRRVVAIRVPVLRARRLSLPRPRVLESRGVVRAEEQGHGASVCGVREEAGGRALGQPLGDQDEAAVPAEPSAGADPRGRHPPADGGVHNLSSERPGQAGQLIRLDKRRGAVDGRPMRGTVRRLWNARRRSTGCRRPRTCSASRRSCSAPRSAPARG